MTVARTIGRSRREICRMALDVLSVKLEETDSTCLLHMFVFLETVVLFQKKNNTRRLYYFMEFPHSVII